MDSTNEIEYSMISSDKLKLQKLGLGMWTSYEPIRQVSRLSHLDSITYLFPFIMSQPPWGH